MKICYTENFIVHDEQRSSTHKIAMRIHVKEIVTFLSIFFFFLNPIEIFCNNIIFLQKNNKSKFSLWHARNLVCMDENVMHQRRITIWTRIPSVTRLLETPIRHLRLYPPGVCEKLKAKLDEREGKRWNIFVKEE